MALPTGFAEELHLGAPHFVQVANVPPAGTASLSLNTAAPAGPDDAVDVPGAPLGPCEVRRQGESGPHSELFASGRR